MFATKAWMAWRALEFRLAPQEPPEALIPSLPPWPWGPGGGAPSRTCSYDDA